MGKSDSTNASQSGGGFSGLLTIVFIVLKLTGVIEWSWLWVLAPLWVGLLLVIAIVIIAVMVLIIAEFMQS